MQTPALELDSLHHPVTIHRDDRGIPYIDAANEEDLYFAQGYATATDRLWQMDFLRRTARGELAEILGPAAVEQDKIHRIYGFTKLAEQLLERASTKTRVILDSYAAGVNAFINSRATLPLEFRVLQYTPREWTAVDSLVVSKLLSESLSVTIDADILRALVADLPADKIDFLLPETSPLDVLLVRTDCRQRKPPDTSAYAQLSGLQRAALARILAQIRGARAASGNDNEAGSNSWVVSGELTASGKPLLASDPHLPPTSPPIFYIAHLSAPGLKVSGVSLPGVPGIMIGHNDRIAWGITNICPDVQDLYIETFDTNDASLYKTPEGWQVVATRREEIKVRNASSIDTVTLEVKTTRHGPIIFEHENFGVALRWTAFDNDVIDLETFLGINSAANWDEFLTALSGFGGPPQNFIYADTNGHIGYHAAGRIPLRKTGDGSRPYDGSTDGGEWVGFIPFQELPHVFDPPSKIIVSANQRMVGDDYPHHITHNWRVPYRARRIQQLIEDKRALTIQDFLAIQGDTWSYPDVKFISEVVKLAENSTAQEWREVIDDLRGWDGYAAAETRVLALAAEMRRAFRRHVLTGALGTERAQLYEWRNEGTFIDNLIGERPEAWLPAEFDSYESLVLACYREAKDHLAKRLGPDPADWTWGRLGTVRFPHPLEKSSAQFATATFPQNTGGSMPTVNAGSRVSMRFVADLSDWANTRLCIPLGQSGEPGNAHHEDQHDEWQSVSPSKLPFEQEDIEKVSRGSLVLKSRKQVLASHGTAS